MDIEVDRWSRKNLLKELFLRLPSVLLAELILYNNDHFYTILNAKFENLFGYFTLVLISKLLIIFALALCGLVLTLPIKFVILIYRSIILAGLALSFNKYLDYVQSLIVPYSILKWLLVCLVYFLIVPVVITLYVNIYQSLIMDKKKMYEFYKSRTSSLNQPEPNNNNIEEVFVAILNEEGLTPLSREELNSSLNKRRSFLFLFTVLSIIINETGLGVWLLSEPRLQQIHIFSTGFILLVFFDLSVNLEQIIFRLFIKIRKLTRLINAIGLNEFLYEFWFNQVKIPFLLRAYFALKCVYFTIDFSTSIGFYSKLNDELSQQSLNEKFSLFESLKSLFFRHNESTIIDEKPSLANNQTNQWKKSLISAVSNLYPIDSDFTEIIFDYIILYLKMLTLTFSQTIVSIAATTCVIALQFRLIGSLMSHLTTGNDADTNINLATQQQQQQLPNDNEFVNVGDVASILFFLLSIQSGLSSLNGRQRIEKFYKNYSLLFIAILHYFHTNLDSQLMTLSASSKPDWKSEKHLRILLVCSSLIVIPCSILLILWSNFSMSTWLLAASAFNIELVVKMTVTLLIYTVFIVDSNRITKSQEKISRGSSSSQETSSKDELSDNLDDCVYFIKAFGHVAEFCVALFLFCNGFYILLFESYGAIRAIMMCIHAYFHIWLQAKKGWSAFMKRRTAIEKLKRLRLFKASEFWNKKDANELLSESELVEFERKTHELCAICFCELCAHEARITNCNHFFHSICLRKWLYLQDSCPMCHQLVYPTSSKETHN